MPLGIGIHCVRKGNVLFGIIKQVTVSDFIPDERNLSDCVGLVEKPGCGSEARGGWGQAAVFGFLAAAIGTTVAGWANVLLLWRGVRHLDETLTTDTRLRHRAPRIVFSAIVMGALSWGLAMWLGPMLPSAQTLVFLIVFVLAVVSYFGLATVLGAFRPADIKQAMRRGKAEPDSAD